MITASNDHQNQEEEKTGFLKKTLTNLQVDDYRYDLSSGYHRLRKLSINTRYAEEAANGLPNPSYPHKIHLSLDILTDSASNETVCEILCAVFKNTYVFAVKFCDLAADPKKVQRGKEAVIYFTDLAYFNNKVDEIEFLAQHVKIIKAVDAQLKNINISKTSQPTTDDLGKALGLNSEAVSIAKSHDAVGHYIAEEKRSSISEESIYTKAHQSAILELKTMNELITESMRHHKKNAGMYGLPTTTQSIANEIKRVNQNETSPLEALAMIKRLMLEHYEACNKDLKKCEPVIRDSFSKLNSFVTRLTQDPVQQKSSSCVLS